MGIEHLNILKRSIAQTRRRLIAPVENIVKSGSVKLKLAQFKKKAKDNVKVFEQMVVDRRILSEVNGKDWVWQEDDKNLSKLMSKVINKDGTFASFYKAKAKVKKTMTKDALELIEASETIMNKMGLELEFKVKPTEDLRKLRKLVEEKYAMINHMEFGRWNWKADTKFIEDFANYINVIDVCGINSQDGS